MLTCVLGAPGSGKTALVPLLRARLPEHVVLDWDAFMDAASALAGLDIRRSPETWHNYRTLVRAIVDSVSPHPVVLLGVCTPVELNDWSPAAWVLLDCSDHERRHRLDGHRTEEEIAEAIRDARQYRALGLPVIDSTARSREATAAAVADLLLGPRNDA